MRKHKILNQKGLALVTVFFIFLVALIVVGAIAIISVTEIGTTRTNQEAEQAFNLAEAGIDWAKAQLAATCTFSTNGFIPTPGIGTSETALVRVENGNPTGAPSTWTVTITAKGSVSGTATAARAIQNTMRITLTTTSTSSGALSGFWTRPLTTNGVYNLTVTNGSGDLNITTSNTQGVAILSNSNVAASISASKITVTGGVKNVGYTRNPPKTWPLAVTQTLTVAEPIAVPSLAFTYLLAQSQAGSPTQVTTPTHQGVQRTGDSLIFPDSAAHPPESTPVRLKGGYDNGGIEFTAADHAMITGTLYAEGNIRILGNNANQVVRGPIYVVGYLSVTGKNITLTGPVYVGGNLILDASHDLTVTGPIYVYGDINIRNASSVTLGGVLYAHGNFYFSNTKKIETSELGVSLVSDKNINLIGGSGSEIIELKALNGLGLLAGGNITINAKQFDSNGLLYSTGDTNLSFNDGAENFDLSGVMAIGGSLKVANTKKFTLNWTNLSSVLPARVIGGSGSSTTTTIETSTPISWKEVAP